MRSSVLKIYKYSPEVFEKETNSNAFIFYVKFQSSDDIKSSFLKYSNNYLNR